MRLLTTLAFLAACSANPSNKESSLLDALKQYQAQMQTTVKPIEPAEQCRQLSLDNLCEQSSSKEVTEKFLYDRRFQEGGDLHHLTGSWANTMSREALFHMGSIESFSLFPARRFFEHTDPSAQMKEVHILNPGAGDHLAPVQLSYVLQRSNPNIERVVLTYTEIANEGEEFFAKQLEKLQELGFITNFHQRRVDYSQVQLGEYVKSLQRQEDDSLDYSGPPHITTFSFDIVVGDQRYKTDVRYVVRMSQDDYFREEDVGDLLVSHRAAVADSIEQKFLDIARKRQKPVVTMGVAFSYDSPQDTRGAFSEDFCVLPTLYDISCPAIHFVKYEKSMQPSLPNYLD